MIDACRKLDPAERDRKTLERLVDCIRKSILEGVDWTVICETAAERETTLLRALSSQTCLFSDRVPIEAVIALMNAIFGGTNGVQTVPGAIDHASHHPDTPIENRGATALSFAATYGNLTMLKWLLFHGANANVRVATGYTVLMAAAHAGQADVVRILLERDVDHRIDLDAQCQLGETALIKAIRNQRPNVVIMLLQTRMYAIDPHLPATNGLSAIDYARLGNHLLIKSSVDAGVKAIEQTRTVFRRTIASVLDRLADFPSVLTTLVCQYTFRSVYPIHRRMGANRVEMMELMT